MFSRPGPLASLLDNGCLRESESLLADLKPVSWTGPE